jgi:glutathione S-transferase
MKLYHAPRSRSLRVLWAVEELGLDCEVVATNFREPPPEFAALNPSRTLPVLVDGETVLTESVAILMHLADKARPTPLAVEPGQPGRDEYLQFLILGEASLAAPLNAVVATMFTAPDDQKKNFTVGAIEEGFTRRLVLLEKRLAGREFLAADRFTLADVSVGYALGLAAMIGLAEKTPKAAQDYLARLQARPAYQRAAAR